MHQSNLPEFLYLGNDIPEVLSLYENSLRLSSSFEALEHANAIRRYNDTIIDKKFLSINRKNFDSLYQILENKIPNLRFYIEGRRKSLIRSEQKILKLLDEHKSLDLFRDAFGFRIILLGISGTTQLGDCCLPNNSIELVRKCYDVMNEIVAFFADKKEFILCEKEPVVGTKTFNPDKNSGLIIPKHSLIKPEHMYGVKDYILNPKGNGYQSLHAVFRTKQGYCFEVQVRTLGMHVYAVDGNANHQQYKSLKYKENIEFDRNKVHISGYGISPSSEKVFDFVGLEEPLVIFHRQKTF